MISNFVSENKYTFIKVPSADRLRRLSRNDRHHLRTFILIVMRVSITSFIHIRSLKKHQACTKTFISPIRLIRRLNHPNQSSHAPLQYVVNGRFFDCSYLHLQKSNPYNFWPNRIVSPKRFHPHRKHPQRTSHVPRVVL